MSSNNKPKDMPVITTPTKSFMPPNPTSSLPSSDSLLNTPEMNASYADETGQKTNWVPPREKEKSRMSGMNYGEAKNLKKNLGAEFEAKSPQTSSTQPPGPRPPHPGSKKQQNFSPIHPQSKGPNPRFPPKTDTSDMKKLRQEIETLKLEHAKQLAKKDIEIHFLKCQLSDSAEKLEDVNRLVSGKVLEGWSLFSELPKLKDMSPEQVEKEIVGRGYKHRLIYDPKKPPLRKDFASGTSFLSRESYFRDILDDLRKRSNQAPIPSKIFDSTDPPNSSSSGSPDLPTRDINHVGRGANHRKNQPDTPPSPPDSNPQKSRASEPHSNPDSNKQPSATATSKRQYTSIPENWMELGCPFCGKKPETYAAYRAHKSRCKSRPKDRQEN